MLRNSPFCKLTDSYEWQRGQPVALMKALSFFWPQAPAANTKMMLSGSNMSSEGSQFFSQATPVFLTPNTL